MGQEQSPIQQDAQQTQQQPEQQQPPPQDGSLASAASALSGLLSDNGTMPDSDEPESEGATPQGQDEPSQQQQPEQKQDPPDPAKDTPEPLKLSLKIGDKDFTLPIPADTPEEVQQLVKDGLLMRADYTRKTQEVAEGRKVIEAKAQEMGQAMQTIQAMPQQFAALSSIDAQLQQFAQADWQRFEREDPLGAIQAKQKFQDLQMQRGQLLGHMQQTHQQFTAYQQKQVQERMQAALPKIKEAIPDYGKEKIGQMRELAKSIGFTDQQLDQTFDAPPLILLHMALEGQKLRADMAKQQAQVKQQVEKLPPKQVVRSGVAQTQNGGPQINQAAAARLQKSGKVDDAAAVLRSLLG